LIRVGTWVEDHIEISRCAELIARHACSLFLMEQSDQSHARKTVYPVGPRSPADAQHITLAAWGLHSPDRRTAPAHICGLGFANRARGYDNLCYHTDL